MNLTFLHENCLTKISHQDNRIIASLTSCSVLWHVVPSPRRQPSPDWSNLAMPPALDQSQHGDGAAGPCALLSAYGACTEIKPTTCIDFYHELHQIKDIIKIVLDTSLLSV